MSRNKNIPGGSELKGDLVGVRDRFLALNEARLERVRGDLRSRHREFLELLPLIYHLNHPSLPGYVSKTVACGVPDYSPNTAAMTFAKRMARGFEYEKRAYRKFDIQAIYLMGSTGTIGYSPSESDFDIWIIYDNSLDDAEVEALRHKTKEIENWAASLKVEASIFLVDPERFKQGQHGQLSHESSGSAQHYLLLEEFYRTGVLLAGRYPAWWLVNPDDEANYDLAVQELANERRILPGEYIDLGSPQRIQADEFYGATLWLLYKGISAPYKSVLKLLLMEAYASEYPDFEMLSQQFKRMIFRGVTDINQLDPYLMLFRRVEAHLQQREEADRIELARRSFYIKVNEKLTDTTQRSGQDSWRRDLMTQVVRGDWNWQNELLQEIDNRASWKLPRVTKERRILIAELTHSYRFLSDFARNQASVNLINQADLNILGRKLYAAFERKAGKIEIIYRGITDDMHESHVSIHRLVGEDGNEFWMAFSGMVNERDLLITPPLKRAYSVIELLAWCHFNKIIGTNTLLALFGRGSALTERELRAILKQLDKLFPDAAIEDATIYDMRQTPRLVNVATFVNVGLDPFASHTRRGNALTSTRTDALKFGGLFANLALSIDQVCVNSWNEIITYRYVGVSGLLHFISEYFSASPPSRGRRPPRINATSFSGFHSTSIANRIEELLEDIITHFYNQTDPESLRYIVGIEKDYYILSMMSDSLQYEKMQDIEELQYYLSLTTRSFKQVVFDKQTLTETILPHIYARNKLGMVQCFYQLQPNLVSVFILDERGSLFTQTREYNDPLSLVRNYQHFFEATRQRMQFFNQGTNHDASVQNILFYKVDRTYSGDWSIEQHDLNRFIKPSTTINIQVLVDRKGNEDVYTIYCEEREFSTLEFGTRIFNAVARHILLRRSSGEQYPIYITDIDLSRAMANEGRQDLQTIDYLKQKKGIEDRLAKALQERT